MKKKEITLKIEFQNHKLFWNLDYDDVKDRDLADLIVKNAFNSVDKLIGKRANNQLNSWRIEQQAKNNGKRI